MAFPIHFHSVSKRFEDPFRHRKILRRIFARSAHRPKRVLFTNFDLSVAAGEKLLVLGPNGSGKTTLLKLSGGFIRADRGEVTVSHRPAYQVDRGTFGLMLSTNLLYSTLTGYQNLEHTGYLFGIENVRKKIREKAEQWGMAACLDDLVESYSNGQKTMLALARATLHDPPVLLLDEPTAYLDKANTERLTSYLRTSKATLILTTQEPEDFAGFVDRKITL
jgi:ABC-type multidrug transport system ATPase subunit